LTAADVVLALWVTHSTLNIMSLIGVILLMGIVVKNAILLIDFAKWARERGQPLREALIEAGRIRLRPIIMTTFALIAGMVPVAIGHGEGARLPRPARPGSDRRCHHLDPAHPAGDPDVL
jgi:HAE1 family hydrophobic/amphiphilic exporter-1